MMGPRQAAQGALFYEFSIEDYVPKDHPMRAIDPFVDLSDVRPSLVPYHSEGGRPWIDSELTIRMLLLGYCQSIRSERWLCDEVHLNLTCRLFCELDLTDRVPNHSALSKNRYGRLRDSGIFRHLSEKVLQLCIDECLVGGEGFGVDGKDGFCSSAPLSINRCDCVLGQEITRGMTGL